MKCYRCEAAMGPKDERCAQCGAQRGAEPEAAPEADVREPEVHLLEAVAGQRSELCPYCRFALCGREGVVDCPVCGTPHHVECWEENGGCAAYGCEASPGRAMSAWPLSHAAGERRWRREATADLEIRLRAPPALLRELVRRAIIGLISGVFAVLGATATYIAHGALAALVCAAVAYPVALVGMMEAWMVLDTLRSHRLTEPSLATRARIAMALGLLALAIMLARAAAMQQR